MLKILYYLYVCMSVYVPKEVREVGSLKLEFQAVVTYLMGCWE